MTVTRKISLIIVFVILLVKSSVGQLDQLDSLPQHSFVRYDLNKLITKDSATLSHFFEKVWTFESQDSGKARIMHIGDSHLQAGYFSGKMRECLHKSLGCGTRERGFVFPFGMAHTNGPVNYGAKYTGKWRGYKCASNKESCEWGLSGISAKTSDDTTTLKVWTNNHTFDPYYFDKVRVYFRDDSSAFSISLRGSEVDSPSVAVDSLGCFKEFILNKETDTVYFTFLKLDSLSDAELNIQGIELLNQRPGITYSEVGVNGAKVKSFLRCEDFNTQLSSVHPDLVIISLGTNDAYNLGFSDSIFTLKYDTLIQLVKASVPNANIILTTPGDGKRYRKTLLKENLAIRKAILQLAKKHDCGVWDFFNIMGGLGSIDHWYRAGLSARDRIHLNEKGYHLQGQLFYRALAEAYKAHTQNRRKKPVILNEGVDTEKLIEGIFFYNDKEPLIFSGYLFWAFFSVFFIFYSFVYKNTKVRSVYLFVFSLYFYYKAGGFYFFLLLFSTVADFWIGNRIHKANESSPRKMWLTLSIVVNLALLFFYKYSYFITDSINYFTGWEVKPFDFFASLGNIFSSGRFDATQIFLPVGISFYTFQTISYAVDVYRKRIEPVKSMADFGFYVSFFPQLVAGPIVRANEFIPQIHQPYQLTYNQFSRAAFLIIAGLFKKMVISDYLSINFVDRVFESPLKYTGFENLLGAYGYTIQIYCDFSAYSDIAIGLALLLGFTLPENFRAPYLSVNITDFWRRWHMSLSRWLKDYLYIPLGGNRKGKLRTYINLFLTMLLGGLWHGAGLKFILWGGFHGVALAIHKVFNGMFKSEKKSSFVGKFLGWLITFHFVVFCWVFFRAPDMVAVQQVLGQISTHFGFGHIGEILSNHSYQKIFAIMTLGYLLHLVPEKWEVKLQSVFSNTLWPVAGIVAVVAVVVIYQFKSSDIQPFIYFQF